MSVWKDTIRTEIDRGGGQAPCPFCGTPRARRSDYIRCCRCGVNWMNGETLDRDPARERKEKFLASIAATAKAKPVKE